MLLQEPLMTIWFGNFYKPAFDDRCFIDRTMQQIQGMGFNAVLLDSKAWADFALRYKNEEASPYVAQQEYMMHSAQSVGLSHMFLSLYLNGDNLYPNIRFSPPILGESVVNVDGSDGHWYKYWSEIAQKSQQCHVAGLLKLYRENHVQIEVDGKLRLPMCSMWDPIATPSFDEEGKARYRSWLAKRYDGIDAFNKAYGAAFESFSQINPDDYWFTVKRGKGACYSLRDLRENTPDFIMWADNICWLADEVKMYFAAMQKRLHSIEPSLYLAPNLSQWSHVLNMDTSRKSDIGLCELWDTAMRGINMRAVAPYVDMAHYYTVPVTIDGDPDAYVVSCQHAHIRSLNSGRQFYGGIFWGRFLYNDVYRFVTPEEVVGSIVASGASGISAYGICGMDDGGLLHRMDEDFKESLSRANLWAKRVIPRLGERRKGHLAILYPTEMALLEPLMVEGADLRRNDLLGMYHMCCDMGFAPDIVEAEDVINGLAGIDVLIIPANDCYHVQANQELEQALKCYVEHGGVVVHSQYAEVAEAAFALSAESVASTCYDYRNEGGLLLGGNYVSYQGEPIALWREQATNCISLNRIGKGFVYSFGFMLGYQAVSRTAPHVPQSQRNEALYPMTHMEKQPLRDILLKHTRPDVENGMKNVEYALFEGGVIVINHRSTPVQLPAHGRADGQRPLYERMLPGHCAAFIENVDNVY